MGNFIAKHSPIFILAALCVVLALASELFRSSENLQNVMQRTAVVGILSLGQLVVILTAGIDLSVGSVAALGGVAGCMAMVNFGLPVIPGILLGTGVGLGCGFVNGMLTAKGRIPPFIVTLGMMMAARGLALIISGAMPVFGLPESFAWLGGTKGWWLPASLMFGLAALVAFMLRYTRFGRSLYAVGPPVRPARGLDTRRGIHHQRRLRRFRRHDDGVAQWRGLPHGAADVRVERRGGLRHWRRQPDGRRGRRLRGDRGRADHDGAPELLQPARH